MRARIAVVFATLTSFSSVLLSAPAHADENTYLQQMRQPNSLFMDVSDSQLLRLGYVACQAMMNGQSMAQAHAAVSQTAVGMGLSPNMGSVNSIVNEASGYLC